MSGKAFSATEFDIRLGNIIAMRRRMMGMSQAMLAKSIGVSSQQVQKYEAAGNSLSAERLNRIALAFDMTVGQLIDGATLSYPQDKTIVQISDLMASKMDNKKRQFLLQMASYLSTAAN